MLNDLYEILKESLKKLLASRTFILGVFFVFLFGILAVQIFRLQIIEGEEYQENYMTKTKKTIMLAGTGAISLTATGISWLITSWLIM